MQLAHLPYVPSPKSRVSDRVAVAPQMTSWQLSGHNSFGVTAPWGPDCPAARPIRARCLSGGACQRYLRPVSACVELSGGRAKTSGLDVPDCSGLWMPDSRPCAHPLARPLGAVLSPVQWGAFGGAMSPRTLIVARIAASGPLLTAASQTSHCEQAQGSASGDCYGGVSPYDQLFRASEDPGERVQAAGVPGGARSRIKLLRFVTGRSVLRGGRYVRPTGL